MKVRKEVYSSMSNIVKGMVVPEYTNWLFSICCPHTAYSVIFYLSLSSCSTSKFPFLSLCAYCYLFPSLWWCLSSSATLLLCCHYVFLFSTFIWFSESLEAVTLDFSSSSLICVSFSSIPLSPSSCSSSDPFTSSLVTAKLLCNSEGDQSADCLGLAEFNWTGLGTSELNWIGLS